MGGEATGVLPLPPPWTRTSTMPEQRTAARKEELRANIDGWRGFRILSNVNAWRGDNTQGTRTKRPTGGKTADSAAFCSKGEGGTATTCASKARISSMARRNRAQEAPGRR